MLLLTLIANAVGIFTPVITIILFALIAATHHTQLDAKTAFTTLAILALVTHPGQHDHDACAQSNCDIRKR